MSNHEKFERMLDLSMEGRLGDREREGLDAHLAACDVCRAELASARRLEQAVQRLPRELAPGRDLWPDIAARIAGAPEAGEEPRPAQVIEVDFTRPRRPSPALQRWLLAAAAIALVLLSSSLTALWIRGSQPGALSGEPALTSPPTTALVAFQPAEREFVETVGELTLALEAQRDRLQPETIAVVEENLRIIETAIGEARAALEADPNNRDLTFQLVDIYKTKVELLQNAVQLSSL
jgi:hypothetical protein